MATKRTILTVAAAAATLLGLGVVAVLVRETLTKQPTTRDRTDDVRGRHPEVPATEFAPRSHGTQSGDAGGPS
ncbi:hypothetical protein [Mycobacterium sp. AZCC_0083]|uniref:hypothetical protein n=1 Tax=Mycobacterium sp. AZCC_0083 TaxID=2735882 RepID=UPI001612D849|nr:hypothetical protein [Mycobacterium sp. AZCC_0083]MBB5161599.1 hypothetical protein [Mycobacterium sp. AZCC_0083]